jgi:tRNA-binding protein
MGTITWADFDKVEMRVGRIVRVEDFPEAHKPSYILAVDFGPELGIMKSVAALKEDYGKEALLDRVIVAVTNFPPKQIATHMSQVLVLAAENADGSLRLLQPDDDVELGARIR